MAATGNLARGGGVRTGVANEPWWVRALLIGAAVVVLGVLLVLPLVTIFVEAFREGWAAYKDSVIAPETWSAVKLTLITAAIAVPMNLIFGIAAAWAVTKYNFWGKSILVTLIDLPFSVSPVAAGLALVILFNLQNGYLAPLLKWLDFKVIFSLPGMVLATVFITFPFVARELIPLMQSQGTEEEEAAHVLGAGGLQMFWRVTLPNIKWGVLYGIILCNARAMGEFGAVYAVSSNFEGQKTLPLYIERVYYASWVSLVPVFAVASLLGVLAVFTLVVKTWLEWKTQRELAAGSAATG